MTKRKKSNFITIPVVRIITPVIGDAGDSFSLECVDDTGDSKNYPCTVDLYRAVEKDKVHRQYRLRFELYKNESTGLVERLTSHPKTEYQAYKVEYAEEINLPENKLYQSP